MLDDVDRDRLTDFLTDQIEAGVAPGVVVGIVTADDTAYNTAVGDAQLVPTQHEMTLETVFDIASLTKVVATTTAILQLIQEGQLSLWDELSDLYDDLPEEKSAITVFHLMTHTAGFQAIADLDQRDPIRQLLSTELAHGVGESITYSDLDYILLGDIVRQVSGLALDEYVDQHITGPLGMASTAFNPRDSLQAGRAYAATEQYEDRGVVVGEVHDPRAFALGGVAGHAGLFSTVDDLSRFVRSLLLGDRSTVLLGRSMELMRRNHTPHCDTRRGLGWNLKNRSQYSSCGALFSERGYGHTGFTGTSIWIDPDRHLGVILLTNRVHPTRENQQIHSFRPRFHNLVCSLWDRE